MKTAVVLAVAVLANSLANICLSKGMKQYGDSEPLGVSWVLATSERVVSNGWLIVGILFLVLFFAAYLTALSRADLSFVLPSIAPAYLLTAALSKVYLHESVPITRWAGTFLIVAGTCFVAHSYVPPAKDRLNKESSPTVASGLPREPPMRLESADADRNPQ